MAHQPAGDAVALAVLAHVSVRISASSAASWLTMKPAVCGGAETGQERGGARMGEKPQEAVGVPGLREEAGVQLRQLRSVLGRRPEDADVAIVDGAGHGIARGKERAACGLTSGGLR
jgi:hypothetical protein